MQTQDHTPDDNPNENCLEGMKCPKCGSFGPFNILVTQTGWTSVSDDGTDYIDGDTEWDNASPCECGCGHSATVAEFCGEEPTSPQSESSEWWPIETAPKDCYIIGYDPAMKRPFVMIWNVPENQFIQGGGGFDDVMPSLWMPLPNIQNDSTPPARKPAFSETTQVVVFASEGVTRSVATRELPEGNVPCIVVDYDDRHDEAGDISPEAFERKKLGVSLEEFNKTATYIW